MPAERVLRVLAARSFFAGGDALFVCVSQICLSWLQYHTLVWECGRT